MTRNSQPLAAPTVFAIRFFAKTSGKHWSPPRSADTVPPHARFKPQSARPGSARNTPKTNKRANRCRDRVKRSSHSRYKPEAMISGASEYFTQTVIPASKAAATRFVHPSTRRDCSGSIRKTAKSTTVPRRSPHDRFYNPDNSGRSSQARGRGKAIAKSICGEASRRFARCRPSPPVRMKRKARAFVTGPGARPNSIAAT